MSNICELAYLFGLTNITGLGPQLIGRLLSDYGHVQSVCGARLGDLLRSGVPTEPAEKIRKLPEMIPELVARIDYYREMGLELIPIFSNEFPTKLKNIPNPPPLLYKFGEYQPDECDSVAIIGGRNASVAALTFAHQLAMKLAENGLVIISGFARGVDTAAHLGALTGTGKTVAVFGSGLLRPYPGSNRGLLEKILGRGACLSECSPEHCPSPGRLMARNRIVSGLADVVVVIECAVNSGTMDTVRYSKLQKRRLMAVRWPAGSEGYAGWKALQTKGAIALSSSDPEEAMERVMTAISKTTPLEAGRLFQ